MGVLSGGFCRYRWKNVPLNIIQKIHPLKQFLQICSHLKEV
jgi:hypothetical protein